MYVPLIITPHTQGRALSTDELSLIYLTLQVSGLPFKRKEGIRRTHQVGNVLPLALTPFSSHTQNTTGTTQARDHAALLTRLSSSSSVADVGGGQETQPAPSTLSLAAAIDAYGTYHRRPPSSSSPAARQRGRSQLSDNSGGSHDAAAPEEKAEEGKEGSKKEGGDVRALLLCAHLQCAYFTRLTSQITCTPHTSHSSSNRLSKHHHSPPSTSCGAASWTHASLCPSSRRFPPHRRRLQVCMYHVITSVHA